ncbi:MAG: UbiD family decarboxylase, partial [Chloroflexi bacterium]|nr:UbiD family decarboxylase [Chloroflexota bacterium]
MAQDLRTFLKQVQETRPNDLIDVDRTVSPQYETLALVEKLEKQGRFPALTFRNVAGHNMPLLVNLAASYDRLALAIGADVAHMVERFAQLAAAPKPLTWVERADAPVKEIVLTGESVDLSLLPIPVHNELDAGPYLCSGVALVKDPDTGAVNGGVYRHQVQGKDQLGWVVNRTNHGNYVRRRYDALEKPMDVAIVVGHHPALLLAGASRLGGIGGELEVMGGLLGESVEVVAGETVDLPIPARAEIVIEGHVYPGQRHSEGPFGEWPRYYTSSGDYPFVKVSAITMRRDAIYQDVAPSMAEHQVLGALPRMGSLLKRIREVVPTVVNVNLPLSGGGRTYCYVSMRK